MNVWDEKAEWWQERFSDGADWEYEQQMLPMLVERTIGIGDVLDVGTGEGQVARAVAQGCNGRVTAVDASKEMIGLARRKGGDIDYRLGNVCELEFRDESFDAVTMSLVLEHVVDYRRAIEEVARVLRPGGRFLLFLNHPAFQTPGSGWIDDQILEEQYWRSGPYLGERSSNEEVDAGVVIEFHHRPLSAYVNPMIRVRLNITEMVEPAPQVAPQYPEAATIPRLLLLQAEKKLS